MSGNDTTIIILTKSPLCQPYRQKFSVLPNNYHNFASLCQDMSIYMYKRQAQKTISALSTCRFIHPSQRLEAYPYTGYTLFSLSAFFGSTLVFWASRYSKKSFATAGNRA